MENTDKKTRYSFSRVDTYDQCPFKYYLKYDLKNFPPGNAIALEYGTALHAVEEHIANDIKDGKPIDYVSHKNEFIKEMYRLAHKYAKTFYEKDISGRDYMQKSMEYLTSGVYRLEKLMKEHPEYEILGAEVPFNITINDHWFYGKIDRLIRDNSTGRYIIHDVKSYNMPKDDDDLATPLQFVVYTYAVMDMYNCTDDMISCAFDLPLCNMLQPGGTAGYMKRGTTKLNKLFTGIEITKEHKPKPKQLCHWCEFCRTNENADPRYKNLCPYYIKWLPDHKTFDKENEWMGESEHQAIYESFLAKYNIKVMPKGGE